MSIARSEHATGLQRALPAQCLAVAKAYLTLTKPRIAVLLLFTAYAAMVVADGGLPPFHLALFGLLGLGLSAGGAAAINMWYDRDIDAIMSRTANRPLPSGTVTATQALTFGISLGVASVLLLALTVNWLSATLSAAGYLYYAVVYTMWLKRRTPQNIVIGGGAGAFPPLVGWAVVTGHVSVAAALMFLVVLLWTPSHFWGLALYKNEDYARAGVPMMPVVKGMRSTKRQMVVYAALLLASSLCLLPDMRAKALYTTCAVLMGGSFLGVNLRLLIAPDGDMKWAKRTFLASLLYLPAVFMVMATCAVL